LIPKEIFSNPNFKKDRKIVLPDCVQFVIEAKRISGGSIFATIDRDFSESKYIGSEIYLTPFMGESLMYRTLMFSFLNLTKGLVLDTVSYDFNKNTKTFVVTGGAPMTDVALKVFKKIETSKLYDDELFQRWVRAKCKVRLAHMLQTFKYNLPGDVTVSYESITATAEKELEDVKTMMSKENTPDFMLLINQ
jgi:hypothetical protein